jgi:predicted amidophosphoribosyltransferase
MHDIVECKACGQSLRLPTDAGGGLRCPCCAWEFTNEIQPPPESAISPESMEELIDSILKVMRDAGEL